MNFLFFLTIAGIAARLKTTVTAMLRACAPMSDEHPPLPLRPLRGNTHRRVMAGGLILCLGMLTLFALPTDTAAHPQHGQNSAPGNGVVARSAGSRAPLNAGEVALLQAEAARIATTRSWDDWRQGVIGRSSTHLFPRTIQIAAPPAVHPNEIVQWIRVYKNPKTVPQDQVPFKRWHGFQHALTHSRDFETNFNIALRSYLLPSYQRNPLLRTHVSARTTLQSEFANLVWVQFNTTTGELLPDPAKPGESGWVTETEHTSVKPGDRIAIAVRVRGLGIEAEPDMAIGPPETRTYEGRNRDNKVTQTTQIERRWRLNPNMPLHNLSDTTGVPAETDSTYEHTLVYQFVVEAEHVILNEEPWLQLNFTTTPSTRRQGLEGDATDAAYRDNYPIGIDWLYGEAKGVPPPATAVSPFNTFRPDDPNAVDWGVRGGWRTGVGGTKAWTAHNGSLPWQVYSPFPSGPFGENNDSETQSHRHPVLYDPARPDKEPIYYPLIVAGESEQVVRISDVPDASVTGSFTVGLHFVNDFGVSQLFVGHDVSSGGVNALKAALIAKLAKADSPFEVVSLKYVGGIQTAANLATGPRAAGTSTQYSLTLTPRLGLKGDIALKTPVPTEDELAALSASGGILIPGFEVMVPVDTSLRLAGDVVEPSGTYLAGDEVVVRVPFAADGLTYEGDEPPYITIYLGAQTDENRRHATWQRGDETPGSTVVPFVYVIDADDPVASSVNADVNTFAVPAGTTLQTGSGLSVAGTKPAPMDSGEAAPAPDPEDSEGVSVTTPSGERPPVTDTDVDVLPAFLLPSEEEPSEPKADASGVPRSPIVFNELGNGNGETNDWLEIRNVTGSAVSLKDWELSVVQDGNKEDTSLIVFPDVSVPANGLLLITNSNPSSEGNMLAGGEQKGLTHHYIVNAGLSLPDDGKFLLILRNAKEKLGLNEAFIDVAGGGGSGTDAFVRETTGDYDTHVWPLQVLESPGDNTEDALSAGKVWLRAKADVVGYHKDAWAEAAFTGVGYDRMVSKSAETAGTPGYPNGAVKIEAATPRGALTFSEVMLDSAGGTLPQWIELYNSSKTDALNLERWKLEIQNVDSEDLVGRPIVTLTLEEKVIQPNQTLLIVAGNARASSADVFPADRIYNLLALHEKNLRIKSARDTFLSAKGFYLKLIDRNGNVVDEIGNTDGDRRTQDEPIWALPVLTGEEPRSSIIRRYSDGVVSDGASRFGWVLSANFKHFKTGEAVLGETLYYGHADDVGSPGYRQGGALPVELSGFSVTREENGAVLLTWTTESEVDNAGFNVRRSLQRDSGYALLNPVLIAGAGTTGERQTYTFIDTSAKPGVEHYYQLEEVSLAGSPQVLVTRRLRGPVSPAHRALKTLGEVKQVK